MFDNIQNKGVRSDVGPSLITPRNISKLINNKGREEKSIYLLVCDFLPLGCFPEVVDRLSIVGKQRKFFEAEEDEGKRELALLAEPRGTWAFPALGCIETLGNWSGGADCKVSSNFALSSRSFIRVSKSPNKWVDQVH